MAPKKSSAAQSEADVIFTRASVALANTQRLIASWLPPKTDDELARESGGADDRDDDGDFETGNELLGVGAAPPPSNGAAGKLMPKRKDPSLDALRKQLLGRNAAKLNAPGKLAAPVARPVPGRRNPVRKDEDSDSEEEGRGALFDSKSAKGRKGGKPGKAVEGGEGGDVHGVDEDGEGETGVLETEAPTAAPAVLVSKPSKRKATSYLDEVLAEKSVRKKKKKKKQKGGADAEG